MWRLATLILLLEMPLCGLQALAAAAAPSEVLTLDVYLSQVREKHEGLKALALTSEAAMQRSSEKNLLTAPSLFSNVQVASDAKPNMAPALLGTQTNNDNFSVGVSKLTDFGLNAKLYYTLAYTDIEGMDPSIFQNIGLPPQLFDSPRFYEARPTLEINQSLWRNGFGSETQAALKLLEAQARATSFDTSFKGKQLLAEAEGTYWRLVAARETVSIQQDSYERAKKLREWNARQTKLELADKADLLSAEAGLQSRGLELQGALDEERSVSLSFNSLRDIDVSMVNERLTSLDVVRFDDLPVPSKEGLRDDVKAAAESRSAAEADAAINEEKNKPTLDVFGSLSLNGRNADLGGSVHDSFNTDKPTAAAGIKFTTPLDFGQMSEDRAAYIREQQAAELAYRRKLLEEARDWKDLNDKLTEARRRLRLAIAIEQAQNTKLIHERDRLRLGRTTTYQVLLFEQDYAMAELTRLKTQAEILGIIAQMKTFSPSPLYAGFKQTG